jgi:hypothetical protein
MKAWTYAWRRLDLEGLSFVRLEEGSDIVRAEGHEICIAGSERWSTRFVIELNGRWEHRSTVIEVTTVTGRRELRLARLDGHDVVDIAGCPFTNALVLRTHDVPVGGMVEIDAAFIEVPALTVRPLRQRYRRPTADSWEYADDEYGAFEITVDTTLVTVDYEGLASRLP